MRAAEEPRFRVRRSWVRTCDVRFEIMREVDDLDRVARAVLGAVQAREARRLEDDALVLGDLDALGAAHAGVLFEVPAGRNGRVSKEVGIN